MGKVILELIKISSEEKKGVEIIRTPNAETLKAIKEVESGKTEKLSLIQFRKQLY